MVALRTAFVFILLSFQSEAALVNGTAAKVGTKLITVQEAYFYHSLSAFKKGEPKPLKVLSKLDLKKTVQKMIFEELVVAEARNFKFQAVPVGIARKLINRQKGAGREKTWKSLLARYSKTESAALGRIRKSLLVERFVQRKVETLTPIITALEVERYVRQNQSRFKGKKLEAIRPTIVLLLKKQSVEKGLEEWIRFLKKKYQVANYLEG